MRCQDDRARELRKSTLRTPRPNEEYITALRKARPRLPLAGGCAAFPGGFRQAFRVTLWPQGNYMFKYGRQGKPHKAHFQMSEDLAMLSWTSKKGKGQEKRRWIDMSAVQVVEAGQGTVVFQRFPDHEHLKRLSFSILYKKK